MGCLVVFLTACGTVPVAEQSEELRLLIGEINAREQVLDKRQKLLESRARLLASLELQQEFVAERALVASGQEAAMSDEFLQSPKAEAGQCYRLSRFAPRLSAEPQTVVVQDAADEVVVIEPTFSRHELTVVVDYEPLDADGTVPPMRTRNETVVVREPYKSWQPIPAQFSEHFEPMLASPAHKDFVPCEKLPVNSVSFGAHWCVVDIEAEYQQIERRTVEMLSDVREKSVPAETITVPIREPVDASAKALLRPISKTIVQQRLQLPASYRREVRLPEFKTVTVKQLTRPAALAWVEVLCEEADRSVLVKALQEALNERGYEAGEADGTWGEQTAKAVQQYRKDNFMPDIGRDLSLALLKQLEIALPR